MSRQKKEQQKKKKREKVRKERLDKYRQTMLAERGRDDGFLDQIFDINRERDYATSRAMLLEYVERYPKIARPFRELAITCSHMDDYPGMFWAAERLLQVGQRTLEDYTLYRAACLYNGMPAVLQACVEQMQRKFQVNNEDDITFIRTTILADFKKAVTASNYDVTPYSDEQLLELMQAHEKSTTYLSAHRFDLTVKCCDQLIARFPFFTSAYNNKALAIMFDSGPAAAEESLQQALEHHPDDLFAIAFKIRQLALLGRHEELIFYRDRLIALPKVITNEHDFYNTKIEALAWADALEQIVEIYQLAREDVGDEWDMMDQKWILVTHCVAVAQARLGNREAAIELWESIPFGMCKIAADNLEDIQKPVGEQNGPWFFDDMYWIPNRLFMMFRKECARLNIDDLEDGEQTKHAGKVLNALNKKALSLFPALEQTLVEMLKRGGESSRHWVRSYIGVSEMPKLKAAVLEFVKGQSGSDEYRVNVLNFITQQKWLSSGQVQMWQKGELHEIETFGTEIYWEANIRDEPWSEKHADMIYEAQEAAKDGDYEEAIELLTEVNRECPGQSSVLFNIASFHQGIGQPEVYEKMIDEIVRDFPDYFFGKTAIAKRLILQNRTDEAWEILSPLQRLPRMHISEFKTLYGVIVLFHLAKGDEESAQKVYQMAHNVVGDEFSDLEQLRWELKQKPFPPFLALPS